MNFVIKRKRMMDITGMKKFNALGITKFDKTEKGIEEVNSFSSKCKTSFWWTINRNKIDNVGDFVL